MFKEISGLQNRINGVVGDLRQDFTQQSFQLMKETKENLRAGCGDAGLLAQHWEGGGWQISEFQASLIY